MSVIYCNYCDQLSDTDYAPDFDYNEKTGEWKCESCKEEDGEVIAYSELGTYLEKLREKKMIIAIKEALLIMAVIYLVGAICLYL